MMDASKQRIEELFQAALELNSPDERANFLDRTCAGEPALRAEVEELLRAAEAAEAVFQPHERARATARVEPGEPIQERPGSVIGRYKLLQLIGEGGMGAVYMAEQQEPVRRRVALKIIKLGLDTKTVVARFEAERQALALMDHPHIAKVLDGGATDTGRPYFVMELVQGVPITRFCDENRLPTEERLQLFIPVCQAIQHAHQKGIIHRDLKPTNVLVTLNDPAGAGHPMVIDFGVAKAINQKLTEKTLFTNFATMIGTPAYMSPEQAEMSPDLSGDVDTRSDIYSLGVLLYELLTGTTPFPEERLRSAGYVEMQRIICEEKPEKPSTKLTKSRAATGLRQVQTKSEIRNPKSEIDKDLDWIVMKCLEKDRTRRYETANGLAMDLKRHLDNQPVLARPPSRLYEFQKSVRRHKVGFAATAAIIVVLFAGVLVSTWQAVRATRAKAQGVLETERARHVTDFMRQMLATADPSHKGPNYTVRAMLDDFAPAIDAQFPHDPEVAAELHTVIGAAYWSMQEADKARTQLARSMKLRAAVYGTNSPQYADSLVDYANASDAAPEERERSLRMALAIYHQHGIGGERVIHALWALQMLYDGERRLNEIEPLVLAAQAEARRSPGSNYWEIPAMNNGLIAAKNKEGNYAEAEKIARETLAENNRLFGTDYIESAWVYGRLSEALVAQGKYAEALEAAQRAVAIMRKKISPDQTWYGDQLSAVLTTLTAARSAWALTNLFSSADQLANLEALFQERLGSKPLSPDVYNDPVRVATRAVPQFPGLYLELAEELSAAGRTNEAADCRRHAASLRTRLETQDADKPNVVSQLYLQDIRSSMEQGELDKAKISRQKLLSLKHLNAASLNDVAWMLSTIAESELRDGSKAVVFAEQAVAATGRTNVACLDTLAAAYAQAGQFDKAIATEKEVLSLLPKGNTNEYFAQCLSLYQSSIPYHDQSALAAYVYALLQAGKFAEAEPEARECLQLREKLIPNDWRTFNAQSMLGANLLGKMKYADAEPLLLSGYEGLKQREDRIPPGYRQIRLREALERLVQLYQATGQQEKAAEWMKKLDELNSPSAH